MHTSYKNTEPKRSTFNILKHTWKFVLPVKGLFILSLILNFFFSLFSVLSITLIKPIIEIIFDTSVTTEQTKQPENLTFLEQLKEDVFSYVQNVITVSDTSETLFRFGVLVFLVFLLKNIFKFSGNIVNCKFEENVIKDVRDTVFKKISSLSLDFFNRSKLGNLMSIITNDVTIVNQTVINATTSTLREGLQILLFLAVLFSISVKLTLITFVAGLAILGIIRIALKYLKRYASRMQEAMADFTSTMSEILSGIRVVKAFVAEKNANARFRNDTKNYVVSSVKHTKITSLVPILSELAAICALVVVLVQGGLLISQGEIPSADLMLFLFALFSIMAPIIVVTNNIAGFQRGIVAGNRIFRILDLEPSVQDGDVEFSHFQNSIEFKNVSFKYDTERDDYVLKNINLKIEKGKQIALVGASGSGKSTILDLIVRFYDVCDGSILIDGIDLRKLKLNSYRKLFGIVSQENILFNDTIKANITYGLQDFDEQDVIQAAKNANCYNFIQNMPNKFDTQLGDRGVNVSGGERQRIAIARAIIRNPDILIFDEATSALDAESEKIVQEAINNSLKNKTAIIVAHRLSTVINCDEIIVFEKGEIVERGTHQQLIDKNGTYNKLYELQFKTND